MLGKREGTLEHRGCDIGLGTSTFCSVIISQGCLIGDRSCHRVLLIELLLIVYGMEKRTC